LELWFYVMRCCYSAYLSTFDFGTIDVNSVGYFNCELFVISKVVNSVGYAQL